MDRMNVAYDLSFYEMEQERQIARKEKKENVIIKAAVFIPLCNFPFANVPFI